MSNLRMWQAIGSAALTLAVAAILWNYSQLDAMRLAMAKMEHIPVDAASMQGQTSDLYRITAKMDSDLSKLEATQGLILKRLDRLEDKGDKDSK